MHKLFKHFQFFLLLVYDDGTIVLLLWRVCVFFSFAFFLLIQFDCWLAHTIWASEFTFKAHTTHLCMNKNTINGALSRAQYFFCTFLSFFSTLVGFVRNLVLYRAEKRGKKKQTKEQKAKKDVDLKDTDREHLDPLSLFCVCIMPPYIWFIVGECFFAVAAASVSSWSYIATVLLCCTDLLPFAFPLMLLIDFTR